MADTGNSIFNQKAAAKLRSPDDLDKYVRVTNPSVWVVLIACLALLFGLLAWGIFGTVSTTVESTAVDLDGDIVCLLDTNDASEVHVGDDAVVEGENMTVADISAVPVSKEEAATILNSDYLVSDLMKGDWAYVVTFNGDGDYDFSEGVPLTVHITTERVAPISLVLG